MQKNPSQATSPIRVVLTKKKIVLTLTLMLTCWHQNFSHELKQQYISSQCAEKWLLTKYSCCRKCHEFYAKIHQSYTTTNYYIVFVLYQIIQPITLFMRLCKMLQEANILVIIIVSQKGSTSPQGSGQTSSISIQIDWTCPHKLCFCWISSPADHYKVHHSCTCHWHTKMQHDIIIDLHVYLLLNDFCSFHETSAAWCKLDYLLDDVSPLEQSQTVLFAPFKMVRLGSWDHGQY